MREIEKKRERERDKTNGLERAVLLQNPGFYLVGTRINRKWFLRKLIDSCQRPRK